MDVKIENTWKQVLSEEFNKPYFSRLVEFLHKEKQEGQTIYPAGKNIFNAFEFTRFPDVKVVILGQDPYHGAGQAHGLSFSVPDGIPVPPSLKNIYREIQTDLGIDTSGRNGNLENWARQGVFLLNSVLTVRASQPGSHSNIGWQEFTDSVIRILSEKREHLVFMLWGNYARSKKNLIDTRKHLVLEAAHPSPLARGAFMGCRHFSQANAYLSAQGLEPIKW